jgi:hypothetical protein
MGRQKKESSLSKIQLSLLSISNSATTISNVHMKTQERALAPAKELTVMTLMMK